MVAGRDGEVDNHETRGLSPSVVLQEAAPWTQGARRVRLALWLADERLGAFTATFGRPQGGDRDRPPPLLRLRLLNREEQHSQRSAAHAAGVWAQNFHMRMRPPCEWFMFLGCKIALVNHMRHQAIPFPVPPHTAQHGLSNAVDARTHGPTMTTSIPHASLSHSIEDPPARRVTRPPSCSSADGACALCGVGRPQLCAQGWGDLDPGARCAAAAACGAGAGQHAGQPEPAVRQRVPGLPGSAGSRVVLQCAHRRLGAHAGALEPHPQWRDQLV